MTASLTVMQAAAYKALKGAVPVIVRDVGGGGARDLHLDNFNVSNGGKVRTFFPRLFPPFADSPSFVALLSAFHVL